MIRVLFLCLFMLGCGGGATIEAPMAVEPAKFIFLPVGYEDNSKYSGRYEQICNQDFYFRETFESAMVTYRIAGSLEELRAWFYEVYEELIPYWAISFAVRYTDGSVEFWLPGKIIETGEIFIHPASFFEQWTIYLNSVDQKIRHPYDWFVKPPLML